MCQVCLLNSFCKSALHIFSVSATVFCFSSRFPPPFSVGLGAAGIEKLLVAQSRALDAAVWAGSSPEANMGARLQVFKICYILRWKIWRAMYFIGLLQSIDGSVQRAQVDLWHGRGWRWTQCKEDTWAGTPLLLVIWEVWWLYNRLIILGRYG